jgi:hypothetical protein
MEHISPNETICETIRQAYHLIGQANDEAIFDIGKLGEAQFKLREATAMAKAMTAKLTEYKRNWQEGFFDENERFPLNTSKAPIDVLFLCWDDNANTMYRFWQCAKYLGLNSVMFKGKAHPFGYPIQAPIHPSLSSIPISGTPVTVMAPGLESLINSAHVVHLGASTYPMCVVNWKKKNIVVQHGGTVYRQNSKACNDLFNQFAKKTIIQCPDLLGLGATNEEWIPYPVDTTNLKPDITRKDPHQLVIGHFPSNTAIKGSVQIRDVIQRLELSGHKFKYLDDLVNRVSWTENLNRMRQCDIIIETCNPKQFDKPYGEWGNTALEAAALGCAVITNNSHFKQYIKEFGDFGPIIANNADELEARLIELIGTPQAISVIKQRCRDWAVRNHSIPATANRLWDKVYKDFFA